MATVIGEVEAREKFSEIIGRVHQAHEEVIVESSGEPVAAVVPIEVYERFLAERDARFTVLERFRDKLPDYGENEVFADVDEAVRAVRGERAHRHP